MHARTSFEVFDIELIFVCIYAWSIFSFFRQILIDGRNREANDIEGCTLPSLVYLAREKRPQHPHNFKAGAMNALVI